MAEKNNQEIREVSQSFWEEHHSDRDYQYVSGQIFMTRGIGDGYDAQFKSGDPFQIKSLHLGYYISGSIDNTVNLLPKHFEKGQILVATPDSILSQTGRSEDFDMQVLQLDPSYVSEIFMGKTPPLFSSRMSDLTLTPDESDARAYLSLTQSLWDLLHSDTQVQAAINACCLSILEFVCDLIVNRADIKKSGGAHNLAIFNKFVALVNEHCPERRDIQFYADSIGLTKQHLSTVISSVSGRTASSWIDEAILSRIKIMLRHSDLSTSEISDSLNFSAPSHFARFFKNMTGMTPKEYRNEP